MTALEKNKMQSEVKPKLNVALKLEVAKYPLKERPYTQEIAEVLEEILQAADKGLAYLPPRLNKTPGQVWNDAKQKKVEDSKKEEEIQMNRELIRRKRDNQVKSDLKTVKEVKEKLLEDQKKIREEQLKKEK